MIYAKHMSLGEVRYVENTLLAVGELVKDLEQAGLRPGRTVRDALGATLSEQISKSIRMLTVEEER